MFNIAFAVSVLLAAFMPLGQQLFFMVFGNPRLLSKSLGPFATQMLGLFFKYVLLALVIYGALRLIGAHRKVNFKARGYGLILAANVVILIYSLARSLASLVEGGGAHFVLAQFGTFVYWPAWLAIVVGFVQLSRAHASASVSPSAQPGA